MRSVVWDPASLYDPESDRYVGWRKMEVAALRGYTTQAETNRLAQELYAARSGRPEYVALLTPLEPEMRIGQVLEPADSGTGSWPWSTGWSAVPGGWRRRG